MLQFMRMLFPVFSIELIDNNIVRHGIQAANINIITVRIWPWNIKCLYAAYLTEIVLRYPGIKGVGHKGILPAHQPEWWFWHDKMNIAAHLANWAITLLAYKLLSGLDFKTNRFAVTMPRVKHIWDTPESRPALNLTMAPQFRSPARIFYLPRIITACTTRTRLFCRLPSIFSHLVFASSPINKCSPTGGHSWPLNRCRTVRKNTADSLLLSSHCTWIYPKADNMERRSSTAIKWLTALSAAQGTG